MNDELCLVAMSGGVDSSVAAALVAASGRRAVGVTLRLLAGAETGFGCCGSPVDIEDAKRVCETIGIPHYALELSALFEDAVIKPFVASYLSARTPNPCVECNRKVKFGYLLALAEAWGAKSLATGHYARAENGRLLRAKDEAKDQSYFLYTLTRKEIVRLVFPVGELSKTEVREKARSLGLKTADKPESQEICFVPKRDYRGFIASREEAVGASALGEGPIRDLAGRELGRHSGLSGFTVGQRGGLGSLGGEKRYVVRLERESNAVVVGSSEDSLTSNFTVESVSWTGEIPAGAFRAQVRVRHRHLPAAATVEPKEGGRIVSVSFDEPQRAVAPGQAAVFYDDSEVLGGGAISS
jgi:tRNA-specific 2-thiouridylase